MRKTVVTHYSTDFDEIPAIWLLKKFHPEFADVEVKFVPAGSTLDGKPAGSDANVVHVGTGGGPFDHHQNNEYTCSAKLVWEWLKTERKIEDAAIDRFVELVTAFDHAKDLSWGDAADDKYDLLPPALIGGWKMRYGGNDQKVIELGLTICDAAYGVFKSKIAAEKALAEGIVFPTRWGEGIGVYTANEASLQLGEKLGYCMVVKKNPKKGDIRIYSRADRGVDLTGAAKELKKLDPNSDWFLHASKCLLLNGSNKNPTMKPTKLSLEEVINVLKKA